MNWWQKTAKVIETRHIPFQIYAALQNITEKDWKFYKRDKGYRDWSASRRDKAIFNASYSIELPRVSISGWDRQLDYSLMVYWGLPFDTKAYDSAEGLDGMELQAFLRKKTKKETPDGWISNVPEETSSPMFSTPFEVAQWVNSVMEEGPGFDFDDPSSSNDNDPDMFPEWPYDEGNYTGQETDEEMANVRDQRIRGLTL